MPALLILKFISAKATTRPVGKDHPFRLHIWVFFAGSGPSAHMPGKRTTVSAERSTRPRAFSPARCPPDQPPPDDLNAGTGKISGLCRGLQIASDSLPGSHHLRWKRRAIQLTPSGVNFRYLSNNQLPGERLSLTRECGSLSASAPLFANDPSAGFFLCQQRDGGGGL